jgi:hypothetical protein
MKQLKENDIDFIDKLSADILASVESEVVQNEEKNRSNLKRQRIENESVESSKRPHSTTTSRLPSSSDSVMMTTSSNNTPDEELITTTQQLNQHSRVENESVESSKRPYSTTTSRHPSSSDSVMMTTSSNNTPVEELNDSVMTTTSSNNTPVEELNTTTQQLNQHSRVENKPVESSQYDGIEDRLEAKRKEMLQELFINKLDEDIINCKSKFLYNWSKNFNTYNSLERSKFFDTYMKFAQKYSLKIAKIKEKLQIEKLKKMLEEVEIKNKSFLKSIMDKQHNQLNYLVQIENSKRDRELDDMRPIKRQKIGGTKKRKQRKKKYNTIKKGKKPKKKSTYKQKKSTRKHKNTYRKKNQSSTFGARKKRM